MQGRMQREQTLRAVTIRQLVTVSSARQRVQARAAARCSCSPGTRQPASGQLQSSTYCLGAFDA